MTQKNCMATMAGNESSMPAEGAKLENSYRRHLQNPYWVLELSPSADGVQAERQGQKLLGMLATGMAEAQGYPTPLGRCERTPELVRVAMAELNDPNRRLLHAWWMDGWGSSL
jgi:hypothetical protein